MKIAKIIFNDGMEIETEKNGSCFITESKPEFPENLSYVKILSENGEIVYRNAEIIPCASSDGRFWFSLREIPETERMQKQILANVEYIAMMTGVDLDE